MCLLLNNYIIKTKEIIMLVMEIIAVVFAYVVIAKVLMSVIEKGGDNE